jgi:hypothetical protein
MDQDARAPLTREAADEEPARGKRRHDDETGKGVSSVMSAPIQNESAGRERDPASMYAPPWARDAATDAADAAIAATDRLRSALPPAPLLKDPEPRARRRAPAPFEGDVVLREMRARSPLDPDAVPEPPVIGSRSSSYSLLARLSGAVGIAALAAVFVVGAPGSRQDADEGARPFWSRLVGADAVRETPAPKVAERKAEPVADRPVPMMERFAAATPMAEPPQAQLPTQPQTQVPAETQTQVASPPAAPAAVAPPVPTLDREEIAVLYRRGEQLIQQGDVAAARLMFTRAARGGDARSALALGASYDPDVLRKLGVVGVAADAVLARDWYTKASGFGSREAAQRIELMAHGR